MSQFRTLRARIFLPPFHPNDEDPLLCLERDFQLMHWLDAHNYSEAWIGEHPSGGYEIYGQSELFIATAAERTRHIRPGTGVISPPYHHPFMGRTASRSSTIRGHSVGCYLNNATAERTEKVAGHAATRVWPRLRGRRLSAVAAARSHRKSPEKLMCSQLSGDVWASHASGTDCSVARRWAMASAM